MTFGPTKFTGGGKSSNFNGLGGAISQKGVASRLISWYRTRLCSPASWPDV